MEVIIYKLLCVTADRERVCVLGRSLRCRLHYKPEGHPVAANIHNTDESSAVKHTMKSNNNEAAFKTLQPNYQH